VFIGSFVEWQQQYPRSASTAADGGYASATALPLLVESAPIGVLSFHFTAPVNFDDEYRALLTSVAHHAAQAIDRARSYEAAQRARADAEAANRSKDDFLSIISHELRTPLSAVLGWAAMLRSHELDAAREARAIEAIYSNATRQTHLIDELLDVSRIVAGRAPLDLQEVDLAENVRGAVETIMPLAEAKALHVRVAPLPAVRVVADPHRLEQVFVNLLGNAVKFTPSGGHVTVDVTRSEGSVDVRVEDTGRGIDPAFLPHVFERFRQAESTVARSVGGLGLGLFIARCLVDAHGGQIRVESEGENRGATFTVSLPAASGSFLTPPATSEVVYVPGDGAADALPSLHGVRVLLVDDESDVREVMASALQACGATVSSASSVEGALEVLTREQDGFDVLLADIAMPAKDGYELIRQVRARSIGDVARIPAIAVTACAGADERERVLAAGFEMHLIKPFRPETLAHAVASLTNVERASTVAASSRDV
jgi:signal transduction histidine kinase/ActR/RegA family two-component response regulator